MPTKLSFTRREGALSDRVAEIIEAAREHITRSINTAMVHAYWAIGREIVEVEQQGKERAGYGDELIERLAAHRTDRYGKGFGARTLRRIRQFYLTFPQGSALLAEPGLADKWTAPLSESMTPEIRSALLTKSPGSWPVGLPPLLGWTHYLILMRVENPVARAFY